MGILRNARCISGEWVYVWMADHGVAHDTDNTLARHLVCGSFIAPRIGIFVELQETI